MVQLVYGSRYATANTTPLELCEWSHAFQGKFDTDAHAWAYVCYDQQGEVAPQQVRVKGKRGKPDTSDLLLFNFVFLDYDGDEEHDKILECLSRIPQGHYLWQMAVLYFTRGGVRFVYRLAEPLLVEDFGPVVRGISMDLWQLTSLRVDPSTDQWWRCFRLPMVVRNDEKAKGPTWEEDYFREPFFSDTAVLDSDIVPRRPEPLPWGQKAHGGRVLDETMPDPDQELHSVRKRLYRALLRTSRFRHYVFDLVEILPGRRDQTIMAVAGEVVAKAFTGAPEATPEELFVLLGPMVGAMEPEGSETWYEKLWRLVLHSWAGELKKREEREEKHELDLTQRDALLKKMFELLPREDIPNDQAERRSFGARHYCLQTGASAFVIQKDGVYSAQALRNSQLPAHFNDGLLFLDDNGFRTAAGTPLGGDGILNQFSINLDGVEFIANKEAGSRLLRVGDKRILQISPFVLRSDLVATAELDTDVAKWLDCFEAPELLRRWLASALALHVGGTASLYLHGPARVGKSLLAQGVAECFGAQPVPGAQAFSEFNGGLMDSPVIMIDEGLPPRSNGMDVADTFRSMITGSPISVQRKHRDAMVTKIPYRLIFAANSFDMAKQLVGRRTMAAQDRDAFRERILVLDTGSAPAKYLDSNGAMQFTKYSPQGSWLGKECRLARHLIRLYQLYFEEQVFVRDGRLLVEGRMHPTFTMAFDLSGAGREVVDDLAIDISKWMKGNFASVELRKAMHIDRNTGRVWIKKRPYTKMACLRSSLRSSDQYTIALDRFLLHATRVDPEDMAVQQEIDVQRLIFCARAEGLQTIELAALRETRQGVQ